MALEMRKVVLEKDLRAGDPVSIFMAPDQKIMVVKDQGSDLKIETIQSGYVTFNQPVL